MLLRRRVWRNAPGVTVQVRVAPKALAHVVYRTRRLAEMLEWYGTVFGAGVQHQNPAMTFLTFDDEHHRFAFLDLSVIDPEGFEPEANAWVGVTDPRGGQRTAVTIFGPDGSARADFLSLERPITAVSVRAA